MRSLPATLLVGVPLLACSSSHPSSGPLPDASITDDATSPLDGGRPDAGGQDAQGGASDGAADGPAGDDGASPAPEWVPRGFNGVAVQALAAHPTVSSTVYVGTMGMGLFRSKDSGATWTPIDTGLPDANQTVQSLAIDPKTPSTMYVGLANSGLYRSTDGGDTWSATLSGGGEAGAPDAGEALSSPASIVVDTSGSGTAWAVDPNAGVFKSTDAGITWNRTANTGLPLDSGALHALAFEPHSGVLLCSVDSAVVMRSTDRGDTWTPAATGLDADAGAPGAVLTLVTRSDGALFAETQGSGLFTSSDGAGHWTPVPTPQSTGYGGLAVDPIALGTLYVSSGNGGILRSADSGGTWVLGGPPVGVLAISIAADDTLYLATAAGTGVWSREPTSAWP